MIESLAWFFGMLIGGIVYNYTKLHYMLLVAAILSIFSILLIPLIPDVKIKSVEYDPKIVTPELVISKRSFSTTHSFREALIIQFSIFFFSSTFFGLIGAYLQHLEAPIWVYGLNNAIPGILGIIVFWIFGKILDRYGPNALIFYGWMSYSIVFLGLLSQNLIIIFIVWLWPAYAFKIASEYLASRQEDKSKAIRNMALASFFTLAGNVLGGIMGGLLTLFSDNPSIQFQIVLGVSLIGVTGVGATYTAIYIFRIIIRRLVKSNSTSQK